MSPMGQSNGSLKLKLEIVTWPFCGSQASESTGKKGSYSTERVTESDYRRNLVSSYIIKERRNMFEIQEIPWSPLTLP